MSIDDDAVVRPGRGAIAEVDVSGLTEVGDAATFEYVDALGMEAEGFIMLWKDGLVAYENRCPHWSVPIDRDGDEFLDESSSFIICPMHGATFEADTGDCFAGPCMGDKLQKFQVIELDGSTAEIRRASLKLEF